MTSKDLAFACAKAADDAASEHHFVEETTFMISVGLLRLKISRG